MHGQPPEPTSFSNPVHLPRLRSPQPRQVYRIRKTSWFWRLSMHRPLGKIISRLLPFALLALGAGVTAQAPRVYHLQGDYPFTHDPSIAKDGATYYVFATGKAPGGGQFAVRCSEDLEHWRMCGHVFEAIPQWIHQRSPGTTDLWAPDISLEHGEYRLYYAYSLFGKNTSGIALATNKTLDFKSPDYKIGRAHV